MYARVHAANTRESFCNVRGRDCKEILVFAAYETRTALATNGSSATCAPDPFLERKNAIRCLFIRQIIYAGCRGKCMPYIAILFYRITLSIFHWITWHIFQETGFDTYLWFGHSADTVKFHGRYAKSYNRQIVLFKYSNNLARARSRFIIERRFEEGEIFFFFFVPREVYVSSFKNQSREHFVTFPRALESLRATIEEANNVIKIDFVAC